MGGRRLPIQIPLLTVILRFKPPTMTVAGRQNAIACAEARGLLLKRFQESDEIPDLPGVQLELGHAGMTRHDTFGQSFFKRLDLVSFMKISKRRRNR